MTLLSAVALLAGCMSPTSFYNKAAKEFCSLAEECYEDYFSEEYDSISECVDEYNEDVDDYIEEYEEEDCTFDKGEAKECLKALGDATCDDGFDYDACAKVWDC